MEKSENKCEKNNKPRHLLYNSNSTLIEEVTRNITNPEDNEDCNQFLKLEWLNNKTIKTYWMLNKFLYGRLKRWLITHKAQGLTFNGRPNIENEYIEIEYDKMPKQIAANPVYVMSYNKRVNLAIWIIGKWLKQC